MVVLLTGIFCFLLFIYSYTQIDLNLTLSSNPLYQLVQNQLIQIGYFNRPLSTQLFLFILAGMFTTYGIVLYMAVQKKLSRKTVLILILLSCVILFFSYTAFSYDFFNYMFDARILTVYHVNPYQYKALDFQGDLWTRFMHWTHRTYPYGPLWLLITAPFSILGMGKFVLTFFLYKALFLIVHVGNVFLVYAVLKHIKPKSVLYGVILYALNPLILIESLASPHLDSAMLLFLLLGLYAVLIKKKYLLGYAALVASGLIKFLTFPLLFPFLIFQLKNNYWRNKINQFLFLLLILLLGFLAIPIYQRELYAWYFIPVLGIVSLLPEIGWLSIISIGLSVGLLLRYAPFLYIGDYPKYLPNIQMTLFLLPFLLSVGIAGFVSIRAKRVKYRNGRDQKK